MPRFQNLDEVFKDKTLSRKLHKYFLKQGWIEKGEAITDVDKDGGLVAEAIKEEGECVFYFSNNSYPNAPEEAYSFAKKYFWFDGNGEIRLIADLDDLKIETEVFFDLLSDQDDDFLSQYGPVSISCDYESDEVILKRCENQAQPGVVISVNGKKYVRTKTGCEFKKEI